MDDTIEIELDGTKEIIEKGTTIATLMDLVNERDPHLIVERNGRCIYPQNYKKTEIKAGDIIEFINPNLGG
jgi:thiamine biosynthesis protein ThiS